MTHTLGFHIIVTRQVHMRGPYVEESPAEWWLLQHALHLQTDFQTIAQNSPHLWSRYRRFEGACAGTSLRWSADKNWDICQQSASGTAA